MTNKIIIAGLVAIAFVAGSITTGTITFADDDDDELSELACEAGKVMTGILFEDDDEITDILCEAQGALGDSNSISLGENRITLGSSECSVSLGDISEVAFGPVVLLSDGTVKVPTASGGFVNPPNEYGSLPDGVWQDIEGVYNIIDTPANCFFQGQQAEFIEEFRACAVNNDGDVYCVNGGVRNGVLSGEPWTFKDTVLP